MLMRREPRSGGALPAYPELPNLLRDRFGVRKTVLGITCGHLS
jgi:hypothetical protein